MTTDEGTGIAAADPDGSQIVTLRFTPLPAHVRTARFVAAAVARRAGIPESRLDEVRLAVSEACSLAVRAHQTHAPQEPVCLRFLEDVDTFRIEVHNAAEQTAHGPKQRREARRLLDERSGEGEEAPLGDEAGAAPSVVQPSVDVESLAASEDLTSREQLALAVIAGLVDDLQVEHGPHGSMIILRWPIGT